MKSLLIISRPQFGYYIDIFKWCQYLRDEYDVRVLTFDDGKEKIAIEGVKNIYVPNAGSRILRGLLFMAISIFQILLFKGIIIACFFEECMIYKQLFPRKRMILDIRTLAVSADEKIRMHKDEKLKKCIQLYDFVTCISEGVRNKIGVPCEKSALLPLGAERFLCPEKCFDTLKLLYVGTLENRNIEKTVQGFALARKLTGMDMEYDIIGDGPGNELANLNSCVRELGLENQIHIHGYVRHDRLSRFYEKCNIGISFVPLTDYYEYQPPTKTFEYALAGLYVVATDTAANREIITHDNGCLIKDTEDSFAAAITDIINGNIQIDASKIRSSTQDYEWRSIVNDLMKPILEQFDSYENTFDK